MGPNFEAIGGRGHGQRHRPRGRAPRRAKLQMAIRVKPTASIVAPSCLGLIALSAASMLTSTGPSVPSSMTLPTGCCTSKARSFVPSRCSRSKPGELTRRYIDGQRASFVSPIALFLFCVFFMFAVVGLTTNTSKADRRRFARIAKGSAKAHAFSRTSAPA